MYCALTRTRYCFENRHGSLRFLCNSRGNVIAKVMRQYLPCAEVANSTSSHTAEAQSDNPTVCESIKTIEERQVNHKLSGLFAIEKTRCRHGFPRAYVQLPVHDIEMQARDGSGPVTNTMLQSGMVRLSCPHLVKFVDKFEYEGNGIPRINTILNHTDNAKDASSPVRTHNAQRVKSGNFVPAAVDLRNHFQGINAHWRDLRSALVSDEQRKVLIERLGAESAAVFVSGGIGGLSGENVGDVKCLHLHVADSLLRGSGANRFGEWAMEKMEAEYGMDRTGCTDCWQQCSRTHTRTATSWWYTSVKNKSGIRSSLAKRRTEKIQKRATEEHT